MLVQLDIQPLDTHANCGPGTKVTSNAVENIVDKASLMELQNPLIKWLEAKLEN